MRQGDELAYATGGEKLTVYVGDDVIEVVPGAVPETAMLAAFDADGLWFTARVGARPPTLHRTDRSGVAVTPGEVPEAIDIEGRVDLSRAVVVEQGDVWLPGADPDGAYLVRVTAR